MNRDAHRWMVHRRPCVWPNDFPPSLLVVVDTEEEFDWDAPFERTKTAVSAMRHIWRVQEIFARYGANPTYVVDYPIASQEAGYGPLREMVADGQCEIGAHLHPWVNPPFREQVGAFESYTCNLEPSLQFEKLRALHECISESFGRPPVVYKAGRYGIGQSTVPALERLGFLVDTSVNPLIDSSADGGPVFDHFDSRPFWFGESSPLLEVPCTHAYIGLAHAYGPRLRAIASTPVGRRMHATGIMCRTGVLNKVALSPEGYTAEEMCDVTTALISRGQRTFTMTFHSPSVEPGNTPYVRSAGDLERFLARIDTYLAFFRDSVGGRFVTATQLHSLALEVEPPASSHTLAL